MIKLKPFVINKEEILIRTYVCVHYKFEPEYPPKTIYLARIPIYNSYFRKRFLERLLKYES